MEEKRFDLSQLYIVDFAKNLFRKKNAFAMIYLAINVLIITFMVQMFEPNFWLALLYGILIYAATATLALSPLGEWYFRWTNGCKKIEDPEILSRLEPLFREVKERAQTQQTDFKIDDNISLYICEDNSVNAFAMGRRTICVTRGLLNLSDEQIKAVLGHEFGHLASHDTELTLLITVGNFIITALVTVIRVILAFYNLVIGLISLFMGREGAIVSIMNAIAQFITTLCINGLMWVWTHLGILLVMKSSRNAEYEADGFSCNLGYRDGLLSFFRILENLEIQSGEKNGNNIFAALSSSHPETSKRIAQIEAIGTLALEE